MTVNVLIETEADGQVRATLLGWPDISAHGSTERDAIAQLRQLLAARLSQARIVPLDIDLAELAHPWLALADRLRANPLLDEVTTVVAANRAVEPPV